MANKTIHMTKVRQILRHHVQGAGSKQISKLTGVARNTVKRYVRQFTEESMTIEEIDRMSDYELDSALPSHRHSLDPRLEQLQAFSQHGKAT